MDVGDKVNDERAAFETLVRRVTHANDESFERDIEDAEDYHDHLMSMYWLIWKEARRTPSASTGEDGLLELSEQRIDELWSEAACKAIEEAGTGIGNGDVAYMLRPVIFARAIASEAIAADRQSNSRQMTGKQEGCAGAGLGVKTWQERLNAVDPTIRVKTKERAMEAEIADLRAQLARQSKGEPAAYLVQARKPGAWREFATLPGYSLDFDETLIRETPLYAAPPLSSEPQGETA